MKYYDVIIIGGGAAGFSAAIAATKNAKTVAVLDMRNTPARKVMASGGGRCNFTNAAADAPRYFGKNPNFVRGALSRVSPSDVLAWARANKITPIEKAPGQYFSATGAPAVVDAMRHAARGAKIIKNTTILDVDKTDDGFVVCAASGETYRAGHVIIATGGVSFPSLGVSDVGYKIAKKFGHKIIPPRPALCGIATDAFPADLSGISMPVEIKIGKTVIQDNILFTHWGIGGPATYRATVRDISDAITLNLMPGVDAYSWLRGQKQTSGCKSLKSVLGLKIPARVAEHLANLQTKNIADYRDTEIAEIATRINNIVIPVQSIKMHNMAMAEVVRGGVDTAQISSKTMESKLCPGLFFAGEVLDIAGDLGGFNLHWAWASGYVAGQNA